MNSQPTFWYFRVKITTELECPLDSEASVASALVIAEAEPLSLLARALPQGMARNGYWEQQPPQSIIQKALIVRRRHDIESPSSIPSPPYYTRSGRESRRPRQFHSDDHRATTSQQPKMDLVLHADPLEDEEDYSSLVLQMSGSSSLDDRKGTKRLPEGDAVEPKPRQCVTVEEVIASA